MKHTAIIVVHSYVITAIVLNVLLVAIAMEVTEKISFLVTKMNMMNGHLKTTVRGKLFIWES